MAYNQFQLPNQNRPESEWTKKLYFEHANRIIQHVGHKDITLRNEEIAKLYRIYSCELSSVEEKANVSLTRQYGFDLGVKYVVYPLAEMLVDQLVSEYLILPQKKKVYSINKRAINDRLDEKVKFISEEIFREQNKKLEGELGFLPETENPDIELPDDVEEWFAKDYKTNAEELGDDLIDLFMDVLKEKRTIKALLQDFLIGEQATCMIDKKDGHPTIRRTKFNETYVDLDPNFEIQNNINIFAFFPFKTENEILNGYTLKKSQINTIRDRFRSMETHDLLDEQFNFNNSGQDLYGLNNCSKGVSYRGWQEPTSTNRLRVLTFKWKSRKEIRAKIIINKKTGEEIYKLLPKDYKARSKDNIQKTSIEVVRFVEMLGPEIMLDYGEAKERMSFIDNKKKVNLPAISLRGRNQLFSTNVRSVVAKVAPLQKMASDILFELRLAIKANNGRVLVYDVSQIPKQFLDTYSKKNAINRMLHHIKKDKILLFNSKDKSSRATFNQFTALDLTNRGLIQDLINSLMLMEDLGKKFVGITKERQGETEKYQTATANDRSVLQSNTRTEIYFNPFDDFVEGIWNKMLQKSKVVYKKGQVFQYIFGDLRTKFLTIFQDLFNVDLGLYIGNRFKDKRSKEIIDRSAIQALGNATERELIIDLINVLDSETASESKAILEKGLKAYSKIQEANAKAVEAQEEIKRDHEQELQDKKDVVAIKGHEKDIKVANIYADNKTFIETEKIQSEELRKLAEIEEGNDKKQKSEKKPEPSKKPKKE